MLKHIVVSGDSALHLINVLAQGSREDTGYVFSGVICLWLDFVSMQLWSDAACRAGRYDMMSGSVFPGPGDAVVPNLIDLSLYHHEKNLLGMKMAGIDSALHNIIKFTTKVAEQNASVRLGMLDAGSLALVLTAFANADFRLSSLIGTPGKEGNGKGVTSGGDISDKTAPSSISLSAINAEASALAISIHTAKFTKPWRGERLNIRLSLCSSLVDSLLGKDRALDNEYEMTRALFKQIVNANNP